MKNIHPVDESLGKHGRLGDSEIRNVKGEPSHVNPLEALIIDQYGKKGEDLVTKIGSGTINPETGLREYIGIIWPVAALLGAIGTYSAAQSATNNFANWGGLNPWTTPYKSRDSVTTKAMAGGINNFQDLKDFYSKSGRFANIKSISEGIKGLRYHRGGFGEQEKGGGTWNTLLGAGLDSFSQFNPLEALKEKLSPFIKKASRQKRGSLREASSKLLDMKNKMDVGGVSVGQNKDMFRQGANIQGEADKLMAEQVGEEAKSQEEQIFSEFMGLL